MRKEHKTGTLARAAMAIFCATAFVAQASAQDPKAVKMEIENNQLVIKSKKTENGCSFFAQGEAGCIKVKKNEKAKIDFHLAGNTKCNLEAGTDWELNAVYLGGFDAGSKPDTFGFDTTPDTDFYKVDNDFGIADRTSGLVKTLEKSATKLTINDENQADSKYIVWYKVEAVCKRTDGGDAHKSTSDPRVRNGGTGDA